jgi:hypothetical protein
MRASAAGCAAGSIGDRRRDAVLAVPWAIVGGSAAPIGISLSADLIDDLGSRAFRGATHFGHPVEKVRDDDHTDSNHDEEPDQGAHIISLLRR